MTKSVDKGKRGEREAALRMSEWTGRAWRRTQQHKSAGVVGDIEPADPGTVWSRLHVEVKNNERMKIGTDLLRHAVAQAVEDAPDGSEYVVLYRERRGVWVLVVVEAMLDGDGNLRAMLAHYAGNDIPRRLAVMKAQLERLAARRYEREADG